MPGQYDDYGFDRENMRVYDTAGLQRWVDDNPDWADYAGRGISYEAAILADEVGLGTPDTWEHMTISGDTDGWTVTITDDTGATHTIDFGDAYDLAWDYYDAGEWYDYDTEKDIDTGGPE